MNFFSLNKISFFFFLLLCSFLANAQNNGEFLLIGTVLENEAMKLGDVTVTAFDELNEKVSGTVTSKKGHFELTLKMNSDYTIEFSKPGYVSKIISVSTESPGKCTVKKWSHDIESEVSLFKHVSGVDYSLYKRPFAYFQFTEKCSFQKDENFAKTVSAMQNKVRDDVTKAQKEASRSTAQENKVKEEQEKQKQADEKYRQLIAFADEEFNDKNYESAGKIYTQALQMKPNQLYPETQLIRIRNLLAEKQNEKEKPVPKDEMAEKKNTGKEELKEEPAKEPVKPVAEGNIAGKEDLKKTEKKTEALLLRISDDNSIRQTNAEAEKQREIERVNDLKSILAHTNAKRIFLEEIADSKMKMKQGR